MKASAKATPKTIGSGPNGNLAGFDFGRPTPGVSLTGAGQMVGLVEFDGYYAADIASYETQTGVPVVPLQTILLDGFDGIPTTGAYSGNSEVALDIEMAISMAPGLSKVVVFEAGPNGTGSNVLAAMSLVWPVRLRQFQIRHSSRESRYRLQSGWVASNLRTCSNSAGPIGRPCMTGLFSMPRSCTGRQVESSPNETIFRLFSLTPSPQTPHIACQLNEMT